MSLLAISNKDSVFLFDIIALGEDLVFDPDCNLRLILEDSAILKVMHDCRIISDMFYHKYRLEMNNIYDTLASHVVFGTWAIYHGFMPKVSLFNLRLYRF